MMMKAKVLMIETPRQQRKMGFLFKGRARPYWSRALQVKGYQGAGQHHRRPLGRNSRNIATLHCFRKKALGVNIIDAINTLLMSFMMHMR